MKAFLFLASILINLWNSESFTVPNGLNNSLKQFDDTSSSSTIATIDRRNVLLGIVTGVVATTISLTPPAFASSDDLSLYQDSNTGFQIKYPTSWKKTEQTLPDRRRLILFLNDNESGKDKDLMFIAYTSVRDDFTSLGSFGSVDQVGYQTILPKGELMGEKTESVMLSSESKKNSYYFDYVSQVPNQPKVSTYIIYIYDVVCMVFCTELKSLYIYDLLL
jgi:hypothetical protein